MARNRVTIGLTDEQFQLLTELGNVSGKRAGDVAREIVAELLQSLIDMAKEFEENDDTEVKRRKLLRYGMNKMLDAL